MRNYFLAFLFFFISNCFAEETISNVHQALKSAVLCEGEPINIVQNIIEHGSSFPSGYAVHNFGFAMDYKNVVILRDPLIIGSATANAVVVNGQELDFNGIVYAQFTGDYKEIVSLLKLEPVSNPKLETNIGKFERKVPTVTFGKPNTLCQKTIALTPQEKGKFLLGCGWCNGG